MKGYSAGLLALLAGFCLTACQVTAGELSPTPVTSTDYAPSSPGPLASQNLPDSAPGLPATTPGPPTALIESLQGLREDEAQAKVEREGYSWRVVARDGEDFPLTMDYSMERVNVVVVGGIVTSAGVG